MLQSSIFAHLCVAKYKSDIECVWIYCIHRASEVYLARSSWLKNNAFGIASLSSNEVSIEHLMGHPLRDDPTRIKFNVEHDDQTLKEALF